MPTKSVQYHRQGWRFPLPWTGTVASFLDFVTDLKDLVPELSSRLATLDIYETRAIFEKTRSFAVGSALDNFISRERSADERHWRVSQTRGGGVAPTAIAAYIMWGSRIGEKLCLREPIVLDIAGYDGEEISVTLAKTPVLTSMVCCYATMAHIKVLTHTFRFNHIWEAYGCVSHHVPRSSSTSEAFGLITKRTAYRIFPWIQALAWNTELIQFDEKVSR